MFIQKDITEYLFSEGMIRGNISYEFMKFACDFKEDQVLRVSAGSFKPKMVHRFLRKPCYVWMEKKYQELTFDNYLVPRELLDSMNSRMYYSLSLCRKYKKFNTIEEAVKEFERCATNLATKSIKYVKQLRQA